MILNFKKYIIVMCIGIFLTALCIPIFNVNWNVSSDSIIDPITPDINGNEEEIVDDNIKVPTFKEAISAWNYGIQLMNNGKGYFYSTICTAKGSIYGVTQEQQIYFDSYFDGKNYFEDTKTFCAIDLGKTFSRQSYMNENKEVFYRYTENVDKSGGTVKSCIPNWDNVEIQKMSFDQYKSDISLIGYSNFNFTVDKSSNVLYFKDINKDYYEYQISIPSNKLNEFYKQNFVKNSNASDINFKTFIITVFQSKKTGKFASILKNESYSLVKPLGLPVTLETTATTRYSNFKINSDNIIINVPYETN